MKNNQNQTVVLDFTLNKPQPTALMPASLAQKLLQDYASKLQSAHAEDILVPLIEELTDITYNTTDKPSSAKRIENAVTACQNFINERELITNIVAGNWSAYQLLTEEQENDLRAAEEQASTQHESDLTRRAKSTGPDYKMED